MTESAVLAWGRGCPSGSRSSAGRSRATARSASGRRCGPRSRSASVSNRGNSLSFLARRRQSIPATAFAFLPGTWHIANRRLVNMLDPYCEEWEEFEATSEARAMLGGIGNVDHFRTDGYEGFSLRLYEPEEDVWRIWWSSTARPGRLDPPVEGRFSEPGRARFACDDVLDGVPIRMRFDWSDITADSARWEQSFSFDGGATYKPNWVMELTRVT